ncbi:YidB family protein [Janthinobacterium sp. CG_23.3]|uniref:YidB family protein n=1 Tax=Janthinobacterium sp. CG_23.3 TaxID=3349634 RepID=UPI0038D35B1A
MPASHVRRGAVDQNELQCAPAGAGRIEAAQSGRRRAGRGARMRLAGREMARLEDERAILMTIKHRKCRACSTIDATRYPMKHHQGAMMGLLDQLAGQVLGSSGAQQQDSMPRSALLTGVMGLIDSAGGLPGLLRKFQESGLGDQVASWVGVGANQSVSGEQIKDALGADAVGQIARQAGIEPEHASTGLAQLLPQIIDKLTPHGEVPDNDLLQQGLSLLKGKLFG